MNLPGKVARLARSVSSRQARPQDDWAARFLRDGEWRVFLGMDPRDREHAVRVAGKLLAERPGAHEELVAAALLHDCGKSVRRYRLWERVLAGLIPYRAAPRVPWGAARVRARHPELGARLVREAGGRERVAWLIERHHAPTGDPDAALLHRLDDLE